MHTPPVVSAIQGPTGWALRALYPLVSADAPVVEIHVAMEGSWEGHPSGPFSLTRADFDNIVARFNESPNPIPLDTEHSTTWAKEAPAVGWVHELYVREDEDGAHLWAKAELGDKAAEWVRNGEYRFSSGVFEFNTPDRVTGEDIGTTLSSVALTNVPYLLGQHPIQLSLRAARQTELSMKFSREALMAALEQVDGDELTMEQVEAAAALAAAVEGKPKSEAPEAPMADMPDEEEEVDASAPAVGAPLADDMPGDPGAASMAFEALMAATGMDEAALLAALQEKQDAVVQALTGALDAPAADAPLTDAERTELKLSLSARQAALDTLAVEHAKTVAELSVYRKAEADQAVQALVDSGKLVADDETIDEWRGLALSDRKRFDRMASGLKQVVPTEDHALSITPTATQLRSEKPIDEQHPVALSMRRSLKKSRASKDAQDAAIRKAIAEYEARTQAGA